MSGRFTIEGSGVHCDKRLRELLNAVFKDISPIGVNSLNDKINVNLLDAAAADDIQEQMKVLETNLTRSFGHYRIAPYKPAVTKKSKPTAT